MVRQRSRGLAPRPNGPRSRLVDPLIIGAGLNLIGSIFGRKKEKTMTPAQSIMSTATGVTDAAKKTGLNRLTLLGASNATAGAGMSMGGSAPPLASLSVLGDFISDNFSEDAKTRREHNRLQNELLRLEVDRARTLNTVPTVASVAGGGAITGGRGRIVQSGPATGFLNEGDRNAALADERDNTVSFQSHGEQTVVPVGPDFDEVLTGVFIEANNKNKAAKKRMAMGPMDIGSPLTIPPGLVDRTWEIMPPSNPSKMKTSPKPKKNKRRLFDGSWIQ